MSGADRLPEFRNIIAGAAIHIDDAGMALGAVTDGFIGSEADEIDADRDPVGKVWRFAIDEALTPMQCRQSIIRQNRMTAAKPQLRQTRPFAHQNREGARADLG